MKGYPLPLKLRLWLAWRLIRFARFTGQDSRQLVQRAKRSEHIGLKWLLLTAARGSITLAEASSRLAGTMVRLQEKDCGK
jgi:hypothetical protein